MFEYLDLFNKTKGRIVGLERIDTKDYPEYAIRESLLNAIIHRDYNYKGSILISLYDDHFEITSLGGIVKGLSLNDLYLRISESRNPNLANIFYRLDDFKNIFIYYIFSINYFISFRILFIKIIFPYLIFMDE